MINYQKGVICYYCSEHVKSLEFFREKNVVVSVTGHNCILLGPKYVLPLCKYVSPWNNYTRIILKWNFPTTHDCPLEAAVALGGPGPRDSIHNSSYIRVMLWYKTINWTLKRAATWARPRHNWRITFCCLGRTLVIHDLGT